jgi:hypothetical protein
MRDTELEEKRRGEKETRRGAINDRNDPVSASGTTE